MRRLLSIVLLLVAIKANASHIVGGEFEIIYLSPNTYRINLIYYFDVLNNQFGGQPPEEQEPTITAAIYQKSNNAFKRNVVLSFLSRTQVSYTQPACSNGEIVTEKVIYTTVITMSNTDYSSPAGYYIIWERCCRNYTITNIYSDPPGSSANAPTSAGQTFYLEFPPVVKDSEPFINSSPRLFPPLNDYACPFKPYYADFAGTDDDGDSLVYTLVTPLSTQSTLAVPALAPAPYPEVKWKAPFSLTNILNGQPDLRVSRDGFLTVTPTMQGLYVFAVKCEEFRNKIKIGEVRRDFQMLVVEGCAPAFPPEIKGKKKAELTFNDGSNLNVTFENTVSDADRCVEVQISDPDAALASQNFTENVSIRAIALNYYGRADFIKLPAIRAAVLHNNGTSNFTVCFDKCPPFEAGPVQIGIIAYDDACALPLTDTLKVSVNIEPPTNADPVFVTADVTTVVNEGDNVSFPIKAIDADGDKLQINYANDGFALAAVGMSITNVQQSDGSYQAQLNWDTRCNVYDFRTKSAFELDVMVEDQDQCLYTHPDKMVMKLQVKLPGNADPVISTDLVPDEIDDDVLVIHKKVYETLDFNVFGRDLIDKDTLILSGAGDGFTFQKYLITFPGDEDNHGDTQSPFHWTFTCENPDLKSKKEFDFRFIVVDNSNKCRFYKADTLNLKVYVDPPANQAPKLSVVNTNAVIDMTDDYTLEVQPGQQIGLALTSNDPYTPPKLDHVRLQLWKAEGELEPQGYEFANAEGEGYAASTFSWNPDCSIFLNGDYENEYYFTFTTQDDRCYAIKGDTVQVKIIIRDPQNNDADFLPPNFISPNGDEYNNFYAMVRFNDETGELESILPEDNCFGQFVSFTVYNRWGTQLFTSGQRDFRWYPHNEASGVYFYTLKYTSKEYKGTITLRN